MNIKKILFFIVILCATNHAFTMEEKDNRSFYTLPQKNDDLLFTIENPYPYLCLTYFPKPNELGISGFYYKNQISCSFLGSKQKVRVFSSLDPQCSPSQVCRSAHNLYQDYQRLSFLQKRKNGDMFSNYKPI